MSHLNLKLPGDMECQVWGGERIAVQPADFRVSCEDISDLSSMQDDSW